MKCLYMLVRKLFKVFIYEMVSNLFEVFIYDGKYTM